MAARLAPRVFLPSTLDRPKRLAMDRTGALGNARLSRAAGPGPIVSHSTACPLATVPQKAADGFRPPRAPPCPPDGGMTALDPRLSLAPPGSTALAPRRRLPARSLKAGPRLSTTGSTANSTAGSDRQLDRDRRRPLPRRNRLLVPDRDRGLNSYRVSLRRPPAAADRGAGSGIAARLAISRGMSRLLSGSPRGF